MFYGFSLNFSYGISNKSIYLSKASKAFVIMVYSSFTGKTSFLELETGTRANSSKSENSVSCNNIGQGAIFWFSLLAYLRVEPCGEWAKMTAKIYCNWNRTTTLSLGVKWRKRTPGLAAVLTWNGVTASQSWGWQKLVAYSFLKDTGALDWDKGRERTMLLAIPACSGAS